MIGLLRGTLLDKQPPLLLLDVSGIGYEVLAPMTCFYTLPPNGSEITLHTHFVVREDAQQLFGFIERNMRDLFRELIRINGVGPKMALAILSALDTAELTRCIEHNAINTLVKVPGIGRKTAERLLVELKGRPLPGNADSASANIAPVTAGGTANARQDAENALVALGYKPQEAEKAVTAALQECDSDRSEDLIRLALRRMLGR